MMKTCKNCKQTLPIDRFPKRQASVGGVITWCRTCHCIRTNEKVRRDKEIAEFNLREEILNRARFVCANC